MTLIGDQGLLTVVPTDPVNPWNKATFTELFDSLGHEDDASEPEFRNILLFCGISEGSVELPKRLIEHLNTLGLQHYVIEADSNAGGSSHMPIPGGSYLWRGGLLHPVYRLYEDKQSCFMHSIQPLSGSR